MADNAGELVLNRAWRPALSVTSVDGMPPLEHASNVLRPFTSVKPSRRLPTTWRARSDHSTQRSLD